MYCRRFATIPPISTIVGGEVTKRMKLEKAIGLEDIPSERWTVKNCNPIFWLNEIFHYTVEKGRTLSLHNITVSKWEKSVRLNFQIIIQFGYYTMLRRF